MQLEMQEMRLKMTTEREWRLFGIDFTDVKNFVFSSVNVKNKGQCSYTYSRASVHCLQQALSVGWSFIQSIIRSFIRSMVHLIIKSVDLKSDRSSDLSFSPVVLSVVCSFDRLIIRSFDHSVINPVGRIIQSFGRSFIRQMVRLFGLPFGRSLLLSADRVSISNCHLGALSTCHSGGLSVGRLIDRRFNLSFGHASACHSFVHSLGQTID